jgi:hypothetical protein
MSQFDFPRINFSGSAALDTATANNGNYQPNLTLFDQDESEAFIPPRCYIGDPTKCPSQYASQILKDKYGQYYVPIAPIGTENYQAWASEPLGTYSADSSYAALYNYLHISGSTPGYWNYYGDLSVSLNDVTVTGITLPDPNKGSVTFTPQSSGGCPSDLINMLGAELSFNSNFFDPSSRTTAYMSDVDSVGQMCTQIFCGQVGLYKNVAGVNTTFFTGSPVKSTARWMNLSRVLNYTNMVPMGGSASFYSMVEIDPNSTIAQTYSKYAGRTVTALFMKILIHQVYEVRNPDYNTSPKKKVRSSTGEIIEVMKNPALVTISGSITPWFSNDLKTAPLCRIMKSTQTFPITTSGMINPVPKGGTAGIGIPASISMGPMLIKQNVVFSTSTLSIDISNAINEYGYNQGPFPPNAGNGDIQPFLSFDSYNLGYLSLMFQSDSGGSPLQVTTLSGSMYGMSNFIQTGGMIDIPVNPAINFTTGYFYLTMNNQCILQEDSIYITTDTQGIYAEQNQVPANVYMSDGLPKQPFNLRVLFRGNPVQSAVNITLQCINMQTGSIQNTPMQVSDNMPYAFPVTNDGCLTYAFVYEDFEKINTLSLANLTAFAMRAYIVVVRVLSQEPQLQPYLSGQQQITWQVVYDNIFQLYKTLFPIMDIIVPLTEENWSEPFMQQKMLQLIDESNWNQPLYMPVTRDLSAAQRQLLQMWVQQSQQQKA